MLLPQLHHKEQRLAMCKKAACFCCLLFVGLISLSLSLSLSIGETVYAYTTNYYSESSLTTCYLLSNHFYCVPPENKRVRLPTGIGCRWGRVEVAVRLRLGGGGGGVRVLRLRLGRG